MPTIARACSTTHLLASWQKKLLDGPNYINYNIFGTITGRLTTHPESFPVLTSQRGFRQLLKPQNDWFLSLDYNGAEIRTLIGLSKQIQPSEDIHAWNVRNIFDKSVTREEAKTMFFWLAVQSRLNYR